MPIVKILNQSLSLVVLPSRNVKLNFRSVGIVAEQSRGIRVGFVGVEPAFGVQYTRVVDVPIQDIFDFLKSRQSLFSNQLFSFNLVVVAELGLVEAEGNVLVDELVENVPNPSGREFVLIKSYCDEIVFEQLEVVLEAVDSGFDVDGGGQSGENVSIDEFVVEEADSRIEFVVVWEGFD